MAKKRGRPREKKRQEIRINLRLRTDNDPQLQRFAEILVGSSNASDVIRSALRLYARYHDGDLLTLPEAGADDDGQVDVMDDQVSVEDIFEF